ncbi:MAG: ABC transporter substrate-binding protein, partial [Halobacteriota archaeon]|nr:ABC transporter substrate-binding protein [Halobacteriota archaeon]
MAIIGVTTGSDVLQISSSNTAPDFTTYEDNDLFFRTCPSDKLQGLAMARLAINEGYMNVSTIVINNAYGVGFEDVFIQEFEELGGTVIESIKYDPAGTIFDSEVEKACGKEPDFVVLCAYPETGSMVLKTAYEKGYMEDIDWLLSEGLKDDTLAELAGKDESGTYIVAGLKGTAPDPTGPGHEIFKEKFTNEYEKDPTTYCSHSYDAAAVVILAMEHSGSANGPEISSSMRDISNAPGEEVTEISEALKLIREGKEINYQGASSEITFDENGDVLGRYAEWFISEDGSIVFGDPIDITTTEEPVAIETEDGVEEPTATVEEGAETTEEPAMDEGETSTPGFESAFALVGLLTVGLFVSRRRRN